MTQTIGIHLDSYWSTKSVGRVAPPMGIPMTVRESTVVASADLRVNIERTSISDAAKILKTRVRDYLFHKDRKC
jgi:hypothetical protein